MLAWQTRSILQAKGSVYVGALEVLKTLKQETVESVLRSSGGSHMSMFIGSARRAVTSQMSK